MKSVKKNTLKVIPSLSVPYGGAAISLKLLFIIYKHPAFSTILTNRDVSVFLLPLVSCLVLKQERVCTDPYTSDLVFVNLHCN